MESKNFADVAQILVSDKAQLSAILETIAPVMRTQGDYRQMAALFLAVYGDTSTACDEITKVAHIVASKAKNKAAAAEYIVRIMRNVLALDIIANCKPMSKRDAQEITDYWTDTEILDNKSDKNALRLMLDYWRTDKERGFFNLPEPQRTAAQAGNYGAYIERKLTAGKPKKKADTHQEQIAAKRAKLHNFNAHNTFADLFAPSKQDALVNAEYEIYDALQQQDEHGLYNNDDKYISRLILNLYTKIIGYNPHTGTSKECSWKKFCEMFAAAYGVQLTYYQPTKLWNR